MLAGAWRCNIRIFDGKLLLAFVGAVAGDSGNDQRFFLRCLYQRVCCMSRAELEKPFGISAGCIKRNSDVSQIFRNILWRQRMVFVDQTGIQIHKKSPLSLLCL